MKIAVDEQGTIMRPQIMTSSRALIACKHGGGEQALSSCDHGSTFSHEETSPACSSASAELHLITSQHGFIREQTPFDHEQTWFCSRVNII